MAGAVPVRSCSGLDFGRIHTYQRSKWGMYTNTDGTSHRF